MSSRLRRKDEHLLLSLQQKPGRADFEAISLIHNCLPEHDLEEVSLETTVLGVPQRSPLFINAVTGGTPLGARVNAALARVAGACGLPMAVGSQMAALEHPEAAATFRVVRQYNPAGTVWANLGAYATPVQARAAVEMVRASAVQIHLNAPQELAMREGDCRFRGALERIARIVETAGVPVIVKEVGFGMAAAQARLLAEAGVAALDVGGRGGTNFLAIETLRARRNGKRLSAPFPGALLSWGLPTAISLLEVAGAVPPGVEIFASGGMAGSLNIAKSLALGARAAGLAAWPVSILLRQGPRALARHLCRLEQELRLIMLMTGSASLDELRRVPVIVTGKPARWCRLRGIDLTHLARR